MFRVLRKFETFTIRDDVPRTLSRFLITSETRGEEGKGGNQSLEERVERTTPRETRSDVA